MSTFVDFAPLLAPLAFWSVAAIASLIALYGFVARARGAWARALAFATLIFVLANPLIEDYEVQLEGEPAGRSDA